MSLCNGLCPHPLFLSPLLINDMWSCHCMFSVPSHKDIYAGSPFFGRRYMNVAHICCVHYVTAHACLVFVYCITIACFNRFVILLCIAPSLCFKFEICTSQLLLQVYRALFPPSFSSSILAAISHIFLCYCACFCCFAWLFTLCLRFFAQNRHVITHI